MTINNIKPMQNKCVVADLWYGSAEFVVSICPREYIKAKGINM